MGHIYIDTSALIALSDKKKAIQELNSIIESKLLLLEWENKKDWMQELNISNAIKTKK